MTAIDLETSVASLHFPSGDYLTLLQMQALAGGWSWTFATHQEIWSPSLVRLCGLATDARPTYDVILDLAHPEDRPKLDSRSALRDGHVQRDHTFRIIRPDGILRVLSSRSEIFFDANGRPRSAAALVVDVTDLSLRMRAWEEQHSPNQDRSGGGAPGSTVVVSPGSTAASWCEGSRTGEMIKNLADRDATMVDSDVVHSSRSRCREHQGIPPPANSDAGKDRSSALGRACARSTVRRAGPTSFEGVGLDIRSEHLRAARALLGWSMVDLAKASCLSLSTIRRLEEDVHGPAPRNLRCVMDVMRHAGVHFVLTEGDFIAVGKF